MESACVIKGGKGDCQGKRNSQLIEISKKFSEQSKHRKTDGTHTHSKVSHEDKSKTGTEENSRDKIEVKKPANKEEEKEVESKKPPPRLQQSCSYKELMNQIGILKMKKKECEKEGIQRLPKIGKEVNKGLKSQQTLDTKTLQDKEKWHARGSKNINYERPGQFQTFQDIYNNRGRNEQGAKFQSKKGDASTKFKSLQVQPIKNLPRLEDMQESSFSQQDIDQPSPLPQLDEVRKNFEKGLLKLAIKSYFSFKKSEIQRIKELVLQYKIKKLLHKQRRGRNQLQDKKPFTLDQYMQNSNGLIMMLDPKHSTQVRSTPNGIESVLSGYKLQPISLNLANSPKSLLQGQDKPPIAPNSSQNQKKVSKFNSKMLDQNLSEYQQLQWKDNEHSFFSENEFSMIRGGELATKKNVMYSSTVPEKIVEKNEDGQTSQKAEQNRETPEKIRTYRGEELITSERKTQQLQKSNEESKSQQSDSDMQNDDSQSSDSNNQTIKDTSKLNLKKSKLIEDLKRYDQQASEDRKSPQLQQANNKQSYSNTSVQEALPPHVKEVSKHHSSNLLHLLSPNPRGSNPDQLMVPPGSNQMRRSSLNLKRDSKGFANPILTLPSVQNVKTVDQQHYTNSKGNQVKVQKKSIHMKSLYIKNFVRAKDAQLLSSRKAKEVEQNLEQVNKQVQERFGNVEVRGYQDFDGAKSTHIQEVKNPYNMKKFKRRNSIIVDAFNTYTKSAQYKVPLDR